jgi:hypothetical protein
LRSLLSVWKELSEKIQPPVPPARTTGVVVPNSDIAKGNEKTTRNENIFRRRPANLAALGFQFHHLLGSARFGMIGAYSFLQVLGC